MFSHFFIRRPIFAGVISIVIMILGVLSLVSLPVARYPEISPPTITVSALYPGADAQTLADTVASPIEQEVNGVENMLYMNSVCGNDGSYSLTVTFTNETDLDTANVLTQNRVSSAIAKLPQEAQRMGVTVKKKSTDANLYLSLYSPDNSLDGLFLSNYANMQLRDELARSPGVGEVLSYGVGDYSMRIWLNPEAMRVREVSVDEVLSAVRGQNLQVAAGKVGEPPVPDGQANTFSIMVQGRLVDEKGFEEIIIRANKSGDVLRLGDISEIELGSSSYNITSSYLGMDSATLVIYQIPGANALEVVDGVKARLASMEKSFPDGLAYEIVYDNTDVIKASIKQVVSNLFATLALVVFTVYIFLQSFRATIIPSVTIPVSLVGTFGAMAAMGYSINQFTLFGLVLVIGIVVDDAIVVVENCTRLLDEGMDPKQAAMETMNEVSGPVIATTLVLLAVFVPTTMMGGIIGTLFKQFAVTISIATIFSSINALTLSPALCGVLLRASSGPSKNPFFKFFNKSVDNGRVGCTKLVRFAIRRVALGSILFVGMVALAIFGFGQLSSGFVPQEDEGYCIVNLSLPDASSQERMIAFSKEAEKVVGDIAGVKDYITVTGFSILDSVAIPNAGFMIVVFEDWSERSAEEHQRVILQKLNQRFSRIQDGVATAFPVPSLPGVGLTAGISFMLQDRGGVGMETLQITGANFIEDANAQTGLSSMYSPFRAAVPQLRVDIDRDQVLTKGLPLESVFGAMQTFLGSSYINDITLFNRSFQVKAQANRRFRTTPEDILRLEVRHPNGSSIPLSALASIDEIVGPQSITRFNQYPSMKVLGQPSEGFSTGDAMEIVEDMADQKLSSSYGYEWVDLSYQEKMATGSTSIIFALSIILVYLVLAAQYESWSLPITVCLSVPTALLGAVIGISVRGYDNNVYTQVGIVLLIGLATKTAILLVEFANVQRQEGMSLTDAAAKAVDLRLRAVLMTAFSFILGVLPLLFSTGAGSESQKVIGTTVFSGMIVATVISLIAIPMLYYLVARLSGEKDAAPIKAETAKEVNA
ncbi:efflux RND transporter permease subunit [Kiritimatiellota bacterium B12222]|nr:efflux RND transporter permease subunit [Kiritimatiellota bacterium B12222]